MRLALAVAASTGTLAYSVFTNGRYEIRVTEGCSPPLPCAGVPVDLEIYRGVIHEFVKMGRAIPEALQAQADAARALKEALQP